MWPSVLDLVDNNRLWFRSRGRGRRNERVNTRVDNQSPPIRISINFGQLPVPLEAATFFRSLHPRG